MMSPPTEAAADASEVRPEGAPPVRPDRAVNEPRVASFVVPLAHHQHHIVALQQQQQLPQRGSGGNEGGAHSQTLTGGPSTEWARSARADLCGGPNSPAQQLDFSIDMEDLGFMGNLQDILRAGSPIPQVGMEGV